VPAGEVRSLRAHQCLGSAHCLSTVVRMRMPLQLGKPRALPNMLLPEFGPSPDSPRFAWVPGASKRRLEHGA